MMLRSALFQDLKGGPTFLLWGDAQGMADLAALFSRLARNSAAFADLGSIARPVDGHIVTVRAATNSKGLVSAETGLDWLLNSSTLIRFADLVSALAGSNGGHQYLEVGNTAEIGAMVSIGEYPDNLAP